MKTQRTVLALGAGVAAASLLLAGCATPSTAPSATTTEISQTDIDTALDTETTLNFWTWVGNIEDEVALFEAKYPKIDVKVQNVGQGPDHYQKVRAAIAAGKGAPDVIQIEYPYISSFQVTEDLLDLTPYGAADMQSEYVDWVWNQVVKNDQVLAIPQDSGPMGNLYRQDIYEAAGLTGSPETWEEFAAAAKTIKETTGSYITDFPPNDAGVFLGLLWQAGVKPFSYSGGENVGINLDNADSQKVADYWNTLIQEDLVSNDANFTDSWYQGLANGKYAGWLTAAWGPLFLQGTVESTSGLWQAAPLPQYDASAPVSGNVGGSSNAVLAGSENPIAAAELAKFINSDPESTAMMNTEQSLFPTTTALLESPEFTNQESAFFDGQKVNELFAGISPTVDKTFDWPPFMDYVYSSFEETIGTSIADKTDLGEGLTAWQADVAEYATTQGFTVK